MMMRPDMAKVLVERPRNRHHFSHWGKCRGRQRLPIEEWTSREGMKHRWCGGTKSFSDLLGPLRRFLRSQVGRPWDKIFSEICAELPGQFPVREHFLRHVEQFVVMHAVLIDGVPCHGEGRRHG